LDESLLERNNTVATKYKIARDQSSVDELVAMINELSEEDRLQLMSKLQGEAEGSEVTGDDPPEFPGRPQTGGGMDPIMGRSDEPRDRKPWLGADDRAPRYRLSTDAEKASFAKRFPGAAKIGFV
jgi:hypothetical protein